MASTDEEYDDEGAYEGGDVASSLTSILPGLSPGADPSAAAAALTELCDLLAFTEYAEDLVVVPLDVVVPCLVLKIAGDGASADVMLMAARALTMFLDLVPAAAQAVVVHGGIEALVGKMMEIEYLDLAEQCLLGLEKLSRRKPEACLKAGVIMAVLGFIDFFELSNQRTAVSTAANVCKRIPQEYLPTVMEAVPALTNLLEYHDQRIVESAANCFMGLTESFNNSSELLDEFCSRRGVIQKSLSLISPDSMMKLREDTCTGLLAMLVRLATHSLVAVRTLFGVNVSSILGGILKSYDHSRLMPASTCDGKSSNQVEVVLKLCNQLIPIVEKGDQDLQLIVQKEKLIADRPMFLEHFATDILPISVHMVNSGANTYVSYGCVSIVENITYFMEPVKLLEILQKENMPRYLASLLSRKDHHVLFSTVRIVENLMKKFPEVFLDSFFKEGVIHAIRAFSELVDCSQPPTTAKDLSSCLCYAFSPSLYPSSSGGKICRLQKCTLPTLAKHVMSTFFTSSTSKIGVSKSLHKVKRFYKKLKTNNDNSVADWDQEEDQLSCMLDQVMKEVKRKGTMSTFEFIESGIARAFAHYLSNGKYLQRSLDYDSISDDYCVVLKRFQTFASKLLSGQSVQDLPLTSLIQDLQNALSALDRFPVILSSAYKPESRHTHIPAKSSTNHPCLQVCFVKDREEKDICDYEKIMTVDFSSSFDAVEEVLWPKVSKNKNKLQALAKGFIHQKRKANTANNQGESMKQDESRHISASGSNKDETRPKLIFLLDGKQLDRSMSLYQAILQEKISADPDIIVGRTFWVEVHTVTFRMRKELKTSDLQMSFDALQSSLPWGKVGLSWQKSSFFSSLLSAELPCMLEKSNPSYDTLFMLKFLEGLNRFSFQVLSNERSNAFAEGRINCLDDLKVIVPSVAQTEFVSSKLTDKLQQQMQDPLAVSSATLPPWCQHLMEVCPFLFSFESRLKYFYLDVSVLPRNLSQHSEGMPGSTVLPRKKLTVDRNNILVSAAKVMSWPADNKVLLEIEYNGEVGTGIGPILEFYTLISHEFQKCGRGMWRMDQGSFPSNSDFIVAPHGLFPRPWSKESNSSNGIKFSRVLKNFSLLGQLVARAIQDGRILDLPFSKAFYKLLLQKELDIYDIQLFDPELGTSLVEFQALANRKRFLESSAGELSNDVSDLSFRKTRIEDLCLDFSLPGYPDYRFASRRKSHTVNMNNLESYISLVVDASVMSGISRQLEAFKSGFNEVFPLKALQIFTEDELERMLGGEQDAWNLNELVDHISFDHGYSSSCSSAIYFIEIIQEFECQQRRSFLQFLTGSPRLPPGGFAALKPKLTVVRKHCTANVDQELPSVMTCANYLKLPSYSSKEKMREKLLYAISEGQGSFHLS